MKLLMLDLDGTVRRCKSDPKGFINEATDQELIEGAAEAVARYAADGWKIIGITNQGGVAAGHKSMEAAIAEQNYTLQLCSELAAIIFCPDFEGETRVDLIRPGVLAINPSFNPNQTHESLKGTYRKPNPGMLLWTMAWLGVDKADTLYVGDRLEDEQAAAAAEVEFLWAQEWRKLS